MFYYVASWPEVVIERRDLTILEPFTDHAMPNMIVFVELSLTFHHPFWPVDQSQYGLLARP